MSEIEELIDEIGDDEVQKVLGVSRQQTWRLRNGYEPVNFKAYLYALRYLKFLPTLRRTKAYKEWVKTEV